MLVDFFILHMMRIFLVKMMGQCQRDGVAAARFWWLFSPQHFWHSIVRLRTAAEENAAEMVTSKKYVLYDDDRIRLFSGSCNCIQD